MPFPGPAPFIEAARHPPCHPLGDLPIMWMEGEDHWQNGFIREPWGCRIGTNEAPEPCPLNSTEKTFGERGVDVNEGQAFTLYADYNCGSVGRTIQESRNRAINRLEMSEANGVTRWIMRELFAGATDITPTPGQPLPLVGAIATMVGWSTLNIGTCPTLHTPPSMIPYLNHETQIWPDGNRLRAPAGMWMTAGGYEDNLGPDGTPAPDGTVWLYVSGIVSGFRGDIFVTPEPETEALDRSVNDVMFLAERTFALGLECPPAAVLAQVSCCC